MACTSRCRRISDGAKRDLIMLTYSGAADDRGELQAGQVETSMTALMTLMAPACDHRCQLSSVDLLLAGFDAGRHRAGLRVVRQSYSTGAREQRE